MAQNATGLPSLWRRRRGGGDSEEAQQRLGSYRGALGSSTLLVSMGLS